MKKVSINPTLKNAAEKLRNVRKLKVEVSDVMLDFVEYMAEIARKVSPYNFDEPFIPERMWSLAMDATDNIKSGIAFPAVPKTLTNAETIKEIKDHKEELFKVIDKIASKEFAEKCRSLGNPIY